MTRPPDSQRPPSLGGGFPVEDPPEVPPTIDARDEPRDLAAAIAAAMATVDAVEKDRENTEHRYRYASVEAMKKAVRRPLFEAGVILTMRPRSTDSTEVRARSGTVGERVDVRFDFEFRGHGDALVIEGWQGVGIDYSDKAYSKAVTSALKTFVNAQWLLPAEADDDPDRGSPEYGQRRGGESEPPAWSRAASDEDKRAALTVLEELVGNRTRAIEYAGALARVADGFPVAVAKWLRALGDFQAAAQRDEVEHDEAPAPAKAAEAEPEPEPEPESEPGAGTDAVQRIISLANERGATLPTDADGFVLPPGTADPPNMDTLAAMTTDEARVTLYRAAGCICANPLPGAADADREDLCPIRNHGIPF